MQGGGGRLTARLRVACSLGSNASLEPVWPGAAGDQRLQQERVRAAVQGGVDSSLRPHPWATGAMATRPYQDRSGDEELLRSVSEGRKEPQVMSRTRMDRQQTDCVCRCLSRLALQRQEGLGMLQLALMGGSIAELFAGAP